MNDPRPLLFAVACSLLLTALFRAAVEMHDTPKPTPVTQPVKAPSLPLPPPQGLAWLSEHFKDCQQCNSVLSGDGSNCLDTVRVWRFISRPEWIETESGWYWYGEYVHSDGTVWLWPKGASQWQRKPQEPILWNRNL